MGAGCFTKIETSNNYKLNIFVKYRLSDFNVEFVN